MFPYFLTSPDFKFVFRPQQLGSFNRGHCTTNPNHDTLKGKSLKMTKDLHCLTPKKKL